MYVCMYVYMYVCMYVDTMWTTWVENEVALPQVSTSNIYWDQGTSHPKRLEVNQDWLLKVTKVYLPRSRHISSKGRWTRIDCNTPLDIYNFKLVSTNFIVFCIVQSFKTFSTLITVLPRVLNIMMLLNATENIPSMAFYN